MIDSLLYLELDHGWKFVFKYPNFKLVFDTEGIDVVNLLMCN